MAVETYTDERAGVATGAAAGDDAGARRGESRASGGFRLGYRPELDGVRGVAILSVFVYHYFARRLQGGFVGVDVFFVLSGFLITYLLVEEWRRTGRISLKNFYARRALRLLPALFAWALVFAAVALLVGGGARRLILYGVAGSLSYVMNWLVGLGVLEHNPLSITWSLAIEEQFYLLYPPVLGWALRRKTKPLTIVCALCAVVVAVELRRALLYQAGAGIPRVYHGTDTRADSLMAGCLLGVLVSFDLLPRAARAKWAARAGALASVLLLAYVAREVVWTNPKLYEGGLTVVALAAATALGALLLYPPRAALAVLRLQPLVWLGRVSYGLYLWHFPLIWLAQRRLAPATVAVRLSFAALSIIAAALSYYLIERRFLRLKRKY